MRGSALMRPTTMTFAPGFADASTPCAMKNQKACSVHLVSFSSWSTTRTARRPRIGTTPALFTIADTTTRAGRSAPPVAS
jgi:hypothetical protein